MSKPAAHNPSRRRHLLLTFGIVLGVAAGAAAYAAWRWRASLPETSGAFALTGLQAPVEVYRDPHGVPAIFAANRADALHALGWLHASERFFSMEMNRRAGQGRLAETVGIDRLALDKYLRTLDLYNLTKKSYAHYRPEHKALIEAYTQGVNDWLATHRGKLPLEFTLLGIEPEPWRAEDSLVWGKLMGLRLSQNSADELLRGALRAKFPPDMVERLYPSYPGAAPVTTNPPALMRKAETAPVTLPAIPAPALARTMQALAADWPFRTPGASNEWVVSGQRSATGKPILANDPHLGLEAPIMWYLARIVLPDEELKGATVPGLPVMLLGQNSSIAWGFTTTNSDVQDLFIETIDPKDPTRYLTPDGSAPFTTRQEIIKVKGDKPVTLTVRTTRHGPVISDASDKPEPALPDDKHVLALAFTGLSDDDQTPAALLDLNVAHDWDGFKTALQQYQVPPQNVVYADKAGNIGFINPALVPVRKAGDGRYPVDGASGAYDWRGMVPFTALPQIYNPPGGVILNGNNAVVGPGAQYWFGRDWDTPYRAQRIETLLQAGPQLSLADHSAIQGDILSPAAQQLLPTLLARLQPAVADAADTALIRLLQGWDYRMQADSAAPLIFEWWLIRLYDALLREPFGKDLPVDRTPNALAIQQLLERPQGWCDKILRPASADCAPQIASSFARMRSELTARYGADPARWRWGDEHYAPLANKVFDHLPGYTRFFSLRHSSDGGFYTVNRGGNFDESATEHPLIKTHGGGYRAVYDLADPAQSRFMIATGEAGHPLASHYADLLPLWRANQSITLTGTAQALAAQGAPKLLFTPAR